MMLRRGAGVFLMALCAFGCSDSPTAPSASDLSGTWTLISLQPAGQASQPTPSGASYNVSFSDNRISVRADCNSCGGAFALSGRTLSIGSALACTRAACPTMVFENLYTNLLAGDSTISEYSSSRLTLSSSRGELRFTR